jgi:hypothetical protein
MMNLKREPAIKATLYLILLVGGFILLLKLPDKVVAGLIGSLSIVGLWSLLYSMISGTWPWDQDKK